jgi:Domain of unknown function (DUF6745)
MRPDASLAERLAAVHLDRPALRRGAVEEALWRHVAAIGAKTDNYEWVEDIERGFELVHSLYQRGHRVWEPSSSGSWGRFSLWRPDADISYPDRTLRRRDDPVGAPILRVARASLGRRWHVYRTSRTYRRWRQGYAEIPDPANVYRLALAAADEQAIVRAGMPRRDQFEEPHATDRWSAEHRADSNHKQALRTYHAAGHRLRTLNPLVQAFEQGLLFFWIAEYRHWRHTRCILVPRPAIHLDQGRLHRNDGPAVEWRTGAADWFWEGLHVPRRAATPSSERARLQVLVRTRNLELRRQLLDRIGYERFLDIADASLVQQDDYGKLWQTDLRLDGEPLRVVEVVNATPEPDGTYRRYFLRVPPDTETAHAAVAWTFGFDTVSDYTLAAAS